MQLDERESGACPSGTNWYVCQANGFKGCCSVDACDLSTCPDIASSSSSSAATTTVTSTAAPQSSPTALKSPTSSISTSSVLSSTSSTLIPATRASNGPTAASITASPAPITSQTSSPARAKSTVPIIAGCVGGVVFLSVISVLLWFCIRRKRSKSKSNAEYSPKSFLFDSSSKVEESRREVFQEFRGRHKSQPPSSLEPTQQSTHLLTPVEDRPVSDPEKAALRPPPAHEHPAFSSSSSRMSQAVPTHHPGTQIYIPVANESPMHTPPMSSPPMTSHPAYHISKLSSHPAFRSGPGLQSPPRTGTRSEFPHRQTPTPPRLDTQHTPNLYPQELDSKPTVPYTMMEMGADVSESYMSPALPSIFSPPSRQVSALQSNNLQHQVLPRRNNTEASSYSIPIGLGVSSPGDGRTPTTFSPLSASTTMSNDHEFGSDEQRERDLNAITPILPNHIYSLPSQSRHFHSQNLTGKERGITRIQTPLDPLRNWTPTPIAAQITSPTPPILDTLAIMNGAEKEVSPTSISGDGSPERWSGSTCIGPIPEEHLKRLGLGIGGVKGGLEVDGANEKLDLPTPLTAGASEYDTWGSWVER